MSWPPAASNDVAGGVQALMPSVASNVGAGDGLLIDLVVELFGAHPLH